MEKFLKDNWHIVNFIAALVTVFMLGLIASNTAHAKKPIFFPEKGKPVVVERKK